MKEQLISISNKLLEYFGAKETKQLLYLYTFLYQNGREEEFEAVVKDCCTRAWRRGEYEIEEIVKCITHDIPYKPLLHAFDKDLMIEVRRFMEDTGCSVKNNSKFQFIADNLLCFITDRNVLYEFRRFNKAPVPITFEEDMKLFGWLTANKAAAGSGGIVSVYTDWMVLSSMYEVYVKCGFNEMFNFIRKWSESAKESARGLELPHDVLVAMFAEAVSM